MTNDYTPCNEVSQFELIRNAIINGWETPLTYISRNRNLSLSEKEELCKMANRYGVLTFE